MGIEKRLIALLLKSDYYNQRIKTLMDCEYLNNVSDCSSCKRAVQWIKDDVHASYSTIAENGALVDLMLSCNRPRQDVIVYIFMQLGTTKLAENIDFYQMVIAYQWERAAEYLKNWVGLDNRYECSEVLRSGVWRSL